jgi:hypothetical protein
MQMRGEAMLQTMLPTSKHKSSSYNPSVPKELLLPQLETTAASGCALPQIEDPAMSWPEAQMGLVEEQVSQVEPTPNGEEQVSQTDLPPKGLVEEEQTELSLKGLVEEEQVETFAAPQTSDFTAPP